MHSGKTIVEYLDTMQHQRDNKDYSQLSLTLTTSVGSKSDIYELNAGGSQRGSQILLSKKESQKKVWQKSMKSHWLFVD